MVRGKSSSLPLTETLVAIVVNHDETGVHAPPGKASGTPKRGRWH